ncbi:piercer of microtubule wall 1 protein isoform X1 [Passer domesticus]|uniref:piercer of microtubule wall 1 protein isoform X1 n=1 Tax=Passer domesticus TaxID=48849 RepID=UPI0030FE4D82
MLRADGDTAAAEPAAGTDTDQEEEEQEERGKVSGAFRFLRAGRGGCGRCPPSAFCRRVTLGARGPARPGPARRLRHGPAQPGRAPALPGADLVPRLRSSFHTLPHTFSDHLGRFGMCRNESLNTSLEKSHCTGTDTFITAYEHLDFHPSYNPSGPSHCRDQPL